MCPCKIYKSQRRKPSRAARFGQFVLLLGPCFLVSDIAIQLTRQGPEGFVAINALTPAMARDDEDKREAAKQAAEALRELQKQQAEFAREQAKQQAEFAREQAKQQAEFAREQAKQQAESEREFSREGGEREREDGHEVERYEDGAEYKGYDPEDAPPSTLAEMFRRLTKPSKSKSRSGVGGNGLRFNTSRARNEILALNLSRAGAKNARKLGFKIGGSGQFSHLRGNITRLVPPRNLNAAQARDLLKRAEPNGHFAANERYRFYQPARKDEREQRGRTEPARHGPGTVCAATKCFGRQIIRWRDEIQSCASGLRVGIIDTQVDHQHPAFSKAKIHLGGFLPDGAKPALAWHGTGVLSVLAGDPESGTPGLIPQAAFYAANVFFQDKDGETETDTVSILNALDWMSAFDVKVINMSFSGPKDDLVEETIERMSQEGVIFVAAAGNDGPTAEPTYPASYPAVIAVTAVSKDLRNYPYANRGDSLDASAPGVDIWSAVPDGREGFHTGTSFAAPHVTAMLATVYEGAKRMRNNKELFDRLKVIDLGPPGRDPIYGRGLMLAPTSCNDADDSWVAQTSPLRNESVQLTERRSLTRSGRSTPSGEPLSYR